MKINSSLAEFGVRLPVWLSSGAGGGRTRPTTHTHTHTTRAIAKRTYSAESYEQSTTRQTHSSPGSDINFELKLGSLPLPRVGGKKSIFSTYVSRRNVPSLRACFMPFSVSCRTEEYDMSARPKPARAEYRPSARG